MIEIPGYKTLEKIHEGRRLNSFRASHNSNQKTVLIKVANHEANNYLVETWYEITRNLKPEIIVKPMELKSLKGLRFVVLEDFGAKPFSAIAAGPLSVQELLGIFIKVTKALFHIHESNIIHNDINPDNIWFNPKTGQLKISGFGLSTKENTPTDRRGKKDIDQYTIEYISPEQTGRTSLDVTRATDFYSLGCSLYQIVSGKLPFLSQDTLELIHCHLARTPIMPHQINTNIPESLSGIIMKLLEKNPVDRYQSCTGLQKDFEICLAIIQGKNRVDHFLPGRHDLSSDLCFSEKLYGRKKELKSLTRAFAGENETGYPLILIRGAAGVGKSALVEQAFKQSNLNAYFVTGKHDKISSRNAVPSALESVILQILGEGKTKVKKWRDKIINALGNNAQLITDFVPMLEFIIGKQPPVMKLTAIESDTRLNIVLRKFIETIASQKQPLIMFLDDLQWVEPESIRILETIESYPIRGFYIVCAYRDNETHLHHPFIRTINKIRKNKLPVLEINLKALEKETQNHWISDLFCKSVLDTRPFSGLLFEKTDGNPFFIKLFLEYLSNTKLLYQPTKHTWQWNLKQINALPATGNVADFMINKIHQLDLESIELLKTASCLGSSYPIKTLEIVHGKNKETFRAALEPIINKGIIIRDRDDLKFVHDIVLESVYSMMPEPERARLHLKAGRQILSTTLENEIDEQIFNITDQMNSGSNIITESKERVELALLNLKAGQKKLKFSSLEAAEKYFQTGIALLPADAWVSNYKLSLSLFSHRCEILYVIGKYSEAEQTFNQVLDHAELPDHLLRIFEAKSSYLMQSYKAQDVIDTGLTILSKLGYKISPEFNRFLLFKEILGFKKQLLGKKISDLVHLPEITDPRQAAIIRTFIIISRACALNGHPYAQIVLFKSMRFILTHGLTPYAAYIFSFYGTVLSNLLYDLKKGYAFGKLAMEIVEKFKAEKQGILSRHLFTVISINSLGNTKDHLDQLSSIVKKSLESGLFMNIFNLHVMYYFLSFISGSKLKDIEHKMLDSRNDILGSNQIVWIHNLDLLFQVVQALRGKGRKLFLLNDPTDIYDEKSIHQWEKTNTIATISDFYLYHQIISYFLHGGKESLEYAKKAEPYFKSYVSLCSQMTYKFFYCLALLEQYNDSNPVTKHAYLQKIRKNQKFFKMIYSKAPENNPHMYFLIEAEMASSKNRFEKASRYYDKAILSAKESGYLHVEAVSCELAAKFFLKKKQACFARPLILESTRLYRKWGVLLKARELENHYAWLLKEDLPDMLKDNDNDEFKDMDIYSVLKASQAISKEIKPKKLMERLIHLIIENSGAQKAFLLLYSDNQMKIEAFAQTHPDSVEILQGILVEKADKMLAASIVYYTFLSKKSVILNNASLDNRFAYDPYIIENKPVSILCTPIIGKKSVRGVLYLENNLMMGAFTKQRLRILDILITQVVISIENSRLYEKLRYEFKKQVLSTKKIKSHQSQLRKMSSQLAQTEERERKAIADDLHDSVTQTLAMSISILKSINDPNNKENILKMEESRNLLEQSLANIRSLTFQLSSPILYDVGLEPALEWLCEDFFKKHGLQIQYINSTNTFTQLDETTKITLYRAVRELIINIIKHAQTRDASLIISIKDEYFIICIEDKGIGFNITGMNKSDGFGLFSISERMRALKGQIHIHSAPQKGTKIKIKVPILKDSKQLTPA